MIGMNKEDVGHQDANPITQMIWANTIITIALAVPSLTVMLLLRRRIGYRTIQPWMLLIAFACLFMLAGGSLASAAMPFSSGAGLGTYLMLLVTFGVPAMGFYQRREAWNRIRRGERWHTKSRGISYLQLRFPEHVIQRFVEPILCWVAGMFCLTTFSQALGIWLIFSGMCLGVMESLIYDVQLNRMLDQLDGIVEAEVAAENDAFFHQDESQSQQAQAAPSIEQMSGITVGLGPELQRIVAKRRAAKAATAAA